MSLFLHRSLDKMNTIDFDCSPSFLLAPSERLIFKLTYPQLMLFFILGIVHPSDETDTYDALHRPMVLVSPQIFHFAFLIHTGTMKWSWYRFPDALYNSGISMLFILFSSIRPFTQRTMTKFWDPCHLIGCFLCVSNISTCGQKGKICSK